MANKATKELTELAGVFKALGHPTRLWIAKNLAEKERCVCEFVDGTCEEFSSISQHLNVLKRAHVVECEKRGKHIFYRLHYPCISVIIAFMEARNALSSAAPEEKERITAEQRQQLEEFLARLKA